MMRSSGLASALTLALAAAPLAQATCSIVSGVELTFYGFPDNSPPGGTIAHDCGRGFTANGTGTFSNPLTMAAAPGLLDLCEVVYVPFLEKFVRYEDDCSQCQRDFKSGIPHIDVWVGNATKNGGNAQIQCENDLTPSTKVNYIRQPGVTYPFDTGALYAPGACGTKHEYPKNNASTLCYP